MKIYRKDVYSVIVELNREQNVFVSENILTEKIATMYGLQNTGELKLSMRREIKQYKRNKRDFDGSIIVFDNEDKSSSEDDNSSAYKVRKKKSFLKLSADYRRDKTDEILGTIKKFVDEELNAGVVEGKITVTQLLGYFIHRVNFMEDKKTAEIGTNILNQQNNREKVSFVETEAIALIHELTLTKYQVIKLKAYLTSKGIYFPNQRDLLIAREKLRPPIRVELDGDGVSVEYVDLFKSTTQAIIESVSKRESVIDGAK